jgi:hypothetical protein
MRGRGERGAFSKVDRRKMEIKKMIIEKKRKTDRKSESQCPEYLLYKVTGFTFG